MTSILFGIFTGLFIIVSIALVFIVLVQRPQGGGLTGAFGGGGGTDTAFGGRTGDALTVATITAFTIYLLLGIGLNITGNLKRQEAIEAANAPATPAETAPVENVPVTPITAPVTGTEPAPAPTTDGPRPADPNAIPLPPGLPSTTQDPAPAPATAPSTEPAPAPAPAPTGG